MNELELPEEISEEELQEYTYCETNQEVIDSKAGKLEFFNTLKEEFGEKEGKTFYKNIYKMLGGLGCTKKEKEEIENHIVNNKKFIIKLEDILYKKLKGTGEQLDSKIISIETIIILLSNALVKQDISEIIGMENLKKILKEYGFGETIDGINNENSEIHIEEDLENYLILKINSSNFYIINKDTKVVEIFSSYEKITFGENEFFLVKRKSNRAKLWGIGENGSLEQLIVYDEILTDLIDYGYLVIKKEDKYFLLDKNFERNDEYHFENKNYRYSSSRNYILKAINKDNNTCFITLEENGEIIEYSGITPTTKQECYIGKNKGKIFLVKKGYRIDITNFDKEIYENNKIFLLGENKEEKTIKKGDLIIKKSDEDFYGIFNNEGKELFPEEEILEFFINKYGNNPYFGIKIGENYHLIHKSDFKSVFKTQNTKDFKKIFTSIDDDIYFKEIDGKPFLEDMYGRKEELIPREEIKSFLKTIGKLFLNK